MAWSASGLYAYALATESLTGVAAATHGWNVLTNKFYLTSASDTPVYSQAIGSAIYSSTNETHDSGADGYRGRPVGTGNRQFNHGPGFHGNWYHRR